MKEMRAVQIKNWKSSFKNNEKHSFFSPFLEITFKYKAFFYRTKGTLSVFIYAFYCLSIQPHASACSRDRFIYVVSTKIGI